MARRNWTREELLLAFALYLVTPFGKIDKKNPEVIALAEKIGRTPSAVGWKLANFASNDPKLQARGIKGASHGSKAELKIWEEFYEMGEDFIYESERVSSGKTDKEMLDAYGKDIEGKERKSIVKVRINQNFFRKSILNIYEGRCCISGIQNTDFLIASHIRPWAIDEKNRVNPKNGLCLNVLHDRAFDRGLITITEDYRIKLSSKLEIENEYMEANFLNYADKEIFVPKNFEPEKEFLKYHQENVFKG